MNNVKVGVLGVGALGRHHARLYGECEGAELMGVFDVDAATGEKVAAELGTRFYPNLDELCDAVEAMSVAVPTDLHYRVVTDLLKRGLHVLVEKPLAASAGHGQELVATAAQAGSILEVGHVERFNPVITYLEACIDQPRFIEAHRLAPYPPPRPGLRPRGTEVSVVLDLMIHDIEVILHLVHSDVEKVDAVGIPVLSDTEDIANARLKFNNGCVANLTASRVSSESMRKIRVFQQNAYLSLDYQARQGEMVTLDAGGMHRNPVPIEDCNALQRELQDFITCVQQRKTGGTSPGPKVSGQHAHRALEIAELILAAIAETESKI